MHFENASRSVFSLCGLPRPPCRQYYALLFLSPPPDCENMSPPSVPPESTVFPLSPRQYHPPSCLVSLFSLSHAPPHVYVLYFAVVWGVPLPQRFTTSHASSSVCLFQLIKECVVYVAHLIRAQVFKQVTLQAFVCLFRSVLSFVVCLFLSLSYFSLSAIFLSLIFQLNESTHADTHKTVFAITSACAHPSNTHFLYLSDPINTQTIHNIPTLFDVRHSRHNSLRLSSSASVSNINPN